MSFTATSVAYGNVVFKELTRVLITPVEGCDRVRVWLCCTPLRLLSSDRGVDLYLSVKCVSYDMEGTHEEDGSATTVGPIPIVSGEIAYPYYLCFWTYGEANPLEGRCATEELDALWVFEVPAAAIPAAVADGAEHELSITFKATGTDSTKLGVALHSVLVISEVTE